MNPCYKNGIKIDLRNETFLIRRLSYDFKELIKRLLLKCHGKLLLVNANKGLKPWRPKIMVLLNPN